jgi:Collagen triple helix repeat (20 copies)
VGLVLGGGVAAAATKAPASLKACADSKGVLSLSAKGKCARGTKPVALSVRGPAGPAGKNGLNGANGLNGTNGVSGTNGVNGVNGLPGPSDVWGWELIPQLTANLNNAMTSFTLPAGDYTVLQEYGFHNEGGVAENAACVLSPLENVFLPTTVTGVAAGATQTLTQTSFVHLTAATTVSLTCTPTQQTKLYGVLSFTATGTLHDEGYVATYP